MKRFFTKLLLLSTLFLAVSQVRAQTCVDAATNNTSTQTAFFLGNLTAGGSIGSPQFCQSSTPDYYRFTSNNNLFYVISASQDSMNPVTTPYFISVSNQPGTAVVTVCRSSSVLSTSTYFAVMNANGAVVASNFGVDSIRCLTIISGVNTTPSITAPTNLTMTAPQGSTLQFQITVQNATRWAVTSAPTWLSVTPNTGTGVGTYTLSATSTANTVSSARTGTVQFRAFNASGDSSSYNILFTQAAAAACSGDRFEPNPSIVSAGNIGSVIGGGNSLIADSLCLTSGDQDYYSFRANGRLFHALVRGFSATTVGVYSVSIGATSGATSVLTVQTLASTNLDTHLTLMDSIGTVLLVNDDIGSGSFLSRVTYNLAGLQDSLPVLRASVNSYTFTGGGGMFNLAITAVNTGWTATTTGGWFNFPATTGVAGTVTYALSAPANPTATTRTGTIVLTPTVQGIAPVVINILQVGGSPINPCNEVGEPNNSPQTARNLGTIARSWTDSIMCLSTGDHDYLQFVANGQTYFAHVRGFSSATVGNYGLNITVDNNLMFIKTFSVNGTRTDTYLTLYDSTGTIRLAFNDDFGGTLFSQISYIASATPLLLVNGQTLQISAMGGVAMSQVISSRVNWTITGAPAWLFVSPNAGIGGSTNVSFRAGTNYDSVPRTATLTLAGGGFSFPITVTQAGIPPIPNCADGAEPNNTLAQARDLGTIATSFTNENYCLSLNDVDYFRFMIDTNAFIAVVRPYNPMNRAALGRYGLSIVRNGDFVTVRTTIPTGGTTDTYLTICRPNGQLIAQNNDAFTGSLYSSVLIPATNRPPANDEPCNATNLTVSDSSNYAPILAYNTNATVTSSVASTGLCVAIGGDVWFRATMPASGVMTIRTSAGSMRDAVVAVYRGTRCDSIVNLVSCEDDNRNGNGSLMPVVTVQGTAGETIYIRIWGFARQQGTFSIGALNYSTANATGGGISARNRANTTNNQELELKVAPNPASDNVTVMLKSWEDRPNCSVRIINMAGQTVVEQSMPVQIGLNVLNIPTADLPTGMYILKAGDKNFKLQIAR